MIFLSANFSIVFLIINGSINCLEFYYEFIAAPFHSILHSLAKSIFNSVIINLLLCIHEPTLLDLQYMNHSVTSLNEDFSFMLLVSIFFVLKALRVILIIINTYKFLQLRL